MIDQCLKIYSSLLAPVLDFFGLLLALALVFVVFRLLVKFIKEIGR